MSMQELLIEESPSELTRLQRRLSVEFTNLQTASHRARSLRSSFEAELAELTSGDISVVVFGSLAREEFTEGSDIDWTLLIDGVADPRHLEVAHRVQEIVRNLGLNEPGREGIFGNMAFSHDVIHQIGGEDDTNSNTTRRILLLLESHPVGRRDAFDRVLNQVLQRYVGEDKRFLETNAKFHVPRFLLNDIARYWRTMAVDFAYKRRTRAGDGAALRNIKLRMSRKLTFVSGLLACFSLHILIGDLERESIFYSPDPVHEFVRHMRRLLAQSPLEILARVINRHDHLMPIGATLFSAYDEFIGVLSDSKKRERDCHPAKKPLMHSSNRCEMLATRFGMPFCLSSSTRQLAWRN